MESSNSMAKDASFGPHVHVAGVRCPRCTATLFKRRSVRRILDGDQVETQLMCVRCRTFWEAQPYVCAHDRAMVAGGGCALLVTSALAAAMWAAAGSICSEVSGDVSPRCIDSPSVPPGIPLWLLGGLVAATAATGTVVISLIVGQRTLRGYWWHVALWMSSLGVVAGALMGIGLTHHYVPDRSWNNPDLWQQIPFGALAAQILVLTSSVIGTRQRQRDSGPWQLTEVVNALEGSGNRGNKRPPRRLRVALERNGPNPASTPSRDGS